MGLACLLAWALAVPRSAQAQQAVQQDPEPEPTRCANEHDKARAAKFIIDGEHQINDVCRLLSVAQRLAPEVVAGHSLSGCPQSREALSRDSDPDAARRKVATARELLRLAIEDFQASLECHDTPAAHLKLADAYFMQKAWDRVRDECLAAKTLAAQEPQAGNASTADAEACLRVFPHLTVRVSPSVAELTITLQRQAPEGSVPVAPETVLPGTPVPVAPGRYQVVARAPGYATAHRSIDVDAGEDPDPLTIALAKKERDAASGARHEPPRTTSRAVPTERSTLDEGQHESPIWPWLVVGGSVVAAVGLAFGTVAYLDDQYLQEHCPGSTCPLGTSLDPETRRDRNATVANVLIGTGAAVAGVGVGLWWVTKRQNEHPVASTRAATVHLQGRPCGPAVSMRVVF